MSDSATAAAAIPADLPVPLAEFAKTVRGGEEEVWLTLLRIEHGRERHTLLGWRGLIGRHSRRPAQ